MLLEVEKIIPTGSPGHHSLDSTLRGVAGCGERDVDYHIANGEPAKRRPAELMLHEEPWRNIPWSLKTTSVCHACFILLPSTPRRITCPWKGPAPRVFQ
jgi:hypothetical protein